MNTHVVDLSAFIPQDTAVLDILKPGGTESTGWMVTLAGPSHPQTIAHVNDISQKNLRRERQIEAAQINGRKYKPEERDLDEVRRENVGSIVARIVSWTPVRLTSDEPVAFSPSVALDFLMRPEMGWVLMQMREFLNDERSFTKGSAKASGSSQSDISNS